MAIPTIRVSSGRQPVVTPPTTGLNANRNPTNPLARHVVGNNVRQQGQGPTSLPGKLRN